MNNLNLNLGRLLDLTSSSLTGFGKLSSGDTASSLSSDSYEKISLPHGQVPSKVRVLLIRQISVDAWEEMPVNDFGEQDSDRVSCRFKSMILGEGAMYTADVTSGSITWAGEILIDPKLNIKYGGFRTRHIVVRVSCRSFHSRL